MKSLVKQLVLALFVAAFFSHCQNQPTTNADKPAIDSLSVREAIAEGYWVNKAWWETLQSTKSPKKAAEHLGLAGVVVQLDSAGWTAVVNYAFHEGNIYKLQPVDGGNFNLLNTEDNSVAHQFLFKPDSTMFLDSFQMVHIGDAQMDDTDLSYGIMNGTYSLKGKPGNVVFHSNGTVSGLEGYEGYEILFDYVVDEVGADQLMLLKPGDERDFYVFHIKGNQLLLSTVEETKDKDGSPMYKPGKVKYELSKK